MRFGEQPVAPAFQRMLARAVVLSTVRQRIEPGRDRRRVHLAHQLPDVLQLPLAAAVGSDAACFHDRVLQALGQWHVADELRELPRLELDQRHADVAQGMHLGLAARLGEGRFRGRALHVVAHRCARALFVGFPQVFPLPGDALLASSTDKVRTVRLL